MTTAAAKAYALGNAEDALFTGYCELQAAQFHALIQANGGHAYTTDADPDELWGAYLGSYPARDRQYHDCSACRHFIKRYGALVVIAEGGITAPAFWGVENAPADLAKATDRMRQIVHRARVTGPFISSLAMLGEARTGVWRHFYARPFKLHADRLKTAGQAMAEEREDFGTVSRALAEFSTDTVDAAVNILRSDAMYRSEKVLGQAEWLQRLHSAVAAAQGAERRRNVIWRAIAEAPAGFCHPRSSMIGTLLEDIAAGMDFDAVSRRFADKMHPLRYQRPQAAPAAGAIRAAEEAFAKLGLAPALSRRFLRPDELRHRALWLPTPLAPLPAADGVFGHLQPKQAPRAASLTPPAGRMTWERFQREVLPSAARIELQAPAQGPYCALLTATDPTAPPLIQWDREDDRNPVSWYFWHGGSPAHQFSLSAGAWTPVVAIALQPSMWQPGFDHHGKGVFFALEGARDTRQPYLGLFPEMLRGDLHGVRSVIEAHSRTGEAEGLAGAQAAGVMLHDGGAWHATVRVHDAKGQTLSYLLDRWA
jgi:hypothetical protein